MDQGLQRVLSSISSELKELANQTNALQHEMAGTEYRGLDVVAFQSLDAITQTLFCLSDIMSSLVSGLPVRAALDRVCLAKLAQRLDGRHEASLASDTECELWG